MKKIPTLFERDWDGDKSLVTTAVHEGCEWVLAGEGVATRKLDGTCCLVRGGNLYKRREVKKGKPAPGGFELVEEDAKTGKRIGWVGVSDGPEDKWHREAFEAGAWADGTYELIGPKVQGNPEHEDFHLLTPHASLGLVLNDVPREFRALRNWLERFDFEGVVFHHPDGRMAKIKKRDFGMRR